MVYCSFIEVILLENLLTLSLNSGAFAFLFSFGSWEPIFRSLILCLVSRTWSIYEVDPIFLELRFETPAIYLILSLCLYPSGE